ncbi:MAG TPA: undecaprenyl-diphosphate phosphatase [Actinomycetota bacterium]|jgi:undecaprenyl-diphosphatase
MLTYFQAIVMGAIQGFTELFPVSSLGHAVIIPSLIPGWHNLAAAQAEPESFFLAFLVLLHVGTAVALLIFFWREWVRIVGGFITSIRYRRIETPDERLAWLLIVATIPAGLVGVIAEHELRIVFAKPLAASLLLMVNGLILLAGERFRKRAAVREMAVQHGTIPGTQDRRLDTLGFKEAGVIGLAQVLALFAGISRSGITMVAGLVRGLSHEDAARFSFLLATPIILAAGVYKLPDLTGSLGNGIRSQAVVGGIAAGIAAYLSVKFLVRWFETRTLTPFAIYCLVAGAAASLWFAFT